HLHRLKDQQGLSLFYRFARTRQHLHDSARHGRGERAGARVFPGLLQDFLEGEPAIAAATEYVPVVAIADRARLEHALVEPDGERTVRKRIPGERVLFAR